MVSEAVQTPLVVAAAFGARLMRRRQADQLSVWAGGGGRSQTKRQRSRRTSGTVGGSTSAVSGSSAPFLATARVTASTACASRQRVI